VAAGSAPARRSFCAATECEGRRPGLIVEGPAVLDLNGYTIRCRADAAGNEPQAGVLIEGSGATVRNGAVRDCRLAACAKVGTNKLEQKENNTA